MNLPIEDIARLYFNRAVSLPELRDWLAVNQWDLSQYDNELVDDIDTLLARMDDGYIDEATLRTLLGNRIEKRRHRFSEMGGEGDRHSSQKGV